jgi:ABC-type multidrug transport system ATPase subunit
MNTLEVDTVQKRFDEKSLLTDVYLKCETGDIIGLLGRNGTGKSTLLKIIFGIENADNKFIRVNGVLKNKTTELLRDISYLHQDNFIPNNFLVKKAISLSIEKENAAAFYRDETIASLKGKYVKDLSGGELRYLEIKLILSNSSKFVLLDEPYNRLSPVMAEKTNELIVENSKRKGIIITDHNYAKVIKVATKLILMKEGKIHHLKDKMELIEKGYLSEGML